jgi:membrane protein YdbS with pleckstrin-like domain
MLFNKNDGKANDRILYKTKPNMIFGCKKAFFGIVLLIVILSISPIAIKFIGQMQVYLISQVKLSLTKYTAIAFFVIILINVIYIIWQLIGWYSMEYILTESKITIKSGVLSTKKNYMPYATIQDLNTSQSIFARLFNVGSVEVYSAYDNNRMELKNISNPSHVEEIIFSRMMGQRNFQAPPQSIPQYGGYADSNDYYPNDEYLSGNDYYDEYEPITPITHERNLHQKRNYEYYPEDFDNAVHQPRHTYEYEPYDSGFNQFPNSPQRDNHYNRIRDDYSHDSADNYQNNDSQKYHDEVIDEFSKKDQEDIDAIQRHFDKFKK